MGFFSKLWKGVKKTVGKIFKPIKKVFKSFGKFMNKIGIVGQIAMSFILPGIGNALMAGFGSATAALAGGALGSIGEAAGWVLGKAGTFAKTIATGFKTVTGAVTDFLGTTAKYVGGKLNIGALPNQTLSQAFGSEGFAGRLTDSFAKLGDQATNFWNSTTADFAERGIMTPTEFSAKTAAIPVVDKGIATTDIGDPSLDPLDPNSKFQKDFQREFKINPELENSSFMGPYRQLPTDVVSNETLEKQGWFSTALEKATGEKTIVDAITTAPSKAVNYGINSLLEAPADYLKAKVASLGQEEYELEEKESWRINNPYAYESSRYQQETAFSSPSFEDFTLQNVTALNTDLRGTFGGATFYNNYMQRSLSGQRV